MRCLALAIIVVATACSPATSSGGTSTAAPSGATATATPELTFAPPPSPVPVAKDLPRIPNPVVTVAPGAFPILPTLRTKLAVVDDAVVAAARGGVLIYLHNIDMYRRGESPVLPITGPFLAAVSAALKESATPGVKREFTLESLVVDHHVQKPWGTHAYVDVTVTLADRAIDHSAPDQWETGKLRLTGDRLRVSDGWDEANARWFNGFGPLPLDRVRSEIVDPIGFYLALESWAPGYAQEPWRASDEGSTPFTRARAQRLATIDRARTSAQTFEGVTATIERFETIEGLWSGLATVRVNGTRVTTDPVRVTQRTSFERRLRVFLFGQWIPEVVDEEAGPGGWLSGGDLALDRIDVDRA
jgi:hypothetical protein